MTVQYTPEPWQPPVLTERQAFILLQATSTSGFYYLNDGFPEWGPEIGDLVKLGLLQYVAPFWYCLTDEGVLVFKYINRTKKG